MNHTHHDLDGIAGHASGLNDNSGRIAAQIAGCILCQHELEAQVAVKNLLARVEPAAMTASEKASLHGAVQARLGLSATPIERIQDRRRRPMTPWTRISAVAAGLLVVVGVGSVWRDLLGGAAATTTTVAAAFAAEASTDYYAAAPAATTAATTAGGNLSGMLRSVAIEDMASLKAETERLAQSLAPDQAQATSADEAAPNCPVVIADRTILAVEDAVFTGEPIVIYIVEAEEGPEAIVVKTADCTIVDLD
jgi:hypothetical protein